MKDHLSSNVIFHKRSSSIKDSIKGYLLCAQLQTISSELGLGLEFDNKDTWLCKVESYRGVKAKAR